uniref:ATP synthase F0 subunit 8 n=1 Tax=Neuroctenus parus TaxID=498951 RepID=B7SMG9_9HEMI|nr:ATP synthase F0 subunit 8 [Neuroctenus parus]ABZ02063.1 ATP synthase F0 subunit 8 [Neuroctenus parus]
MPHMAPMWWTLLYLTFVLCMLTVTSIIYFYFIPKSKKNKMEKNNMRQ